MLFVLLFHVLLFFGQITGRLSWLMAIGHWGVLIFFVHTSLVLMFSLQRHAGAGRRTYLAFIVRRCFRLLPLSTLVILAVVALDFPVAHIQEGRFVAAQVGFRGTIADLLLIQNITDSECVMATLWSLPFEMQMYFVLPLAYLVAMAPGGWRYMLALWMALALGSALTTRFFHRLDLISFTPCFLPGVLAFSLYRLQHARRSWWLAPIAFLVLTGVYLRFPVEKVGWLCCLGLGCAIPFIQSIPRGAFWRICHLIAKYSYGIYLTHFVLIWLFFQRLAGLPGWVRWIGFTLSVAGLPVLLYHLVEEPMIRFGNRVADAGHWSARPRPRATATRQGSTSSTTAETA